MFSPKLVWIGLQLSGDAATETQNIRILHDIETIDIFVSWCPLHQGYKKNQPR